MKDVSQETLKAIQSNVKVEETQSLERSVDNLLQASWKDFEVADLQPNLIPNGWDSFETYGRGINYVENWDFSRDDLSEFFGGNAMEIAIENGKLKGIVGDGVLSASAILIRDIPHLPIGEYMLRVKMKSSNSATRLYYRTRNISEDRTGKNYELTPNIYSVLEFEFERAHQDSFDIYIYANSPIGNVELGDSLEIDWIQITPIDNQHLVVEKTPLENGLTRIQTWGGNDRIKLRGVSLDNQTKEIEYNASLHINNIGENEVEVWGFGYQNNSILKPKEGKFSVLNREPSNARHDLRIRTLNVSDNLDFIASTPQIVEGDKHNPVLVVDQLDDGTEHVRVYGAYPDTKLVYKGGTGFIGENYKLTSNIKNEGVELYINTSLGSSTIPKGDSKLEIEGELQEQDFTIELGARDV